MAEPFIKLPPRVRIVSARRVHIADRQRQFMEYYEVIKNPMSLEMVDTKLKNKEYQTLKEVVTDIGQIFNNAKRCELSLLPHTITHTPGHH